MADATSSGRSWLRYGCFGCFGCVGFVLLLVGGALLAAWLGVRNEDVFDGATGELSAPSEPQATGGEPGGPFESAEPGAAGDAAEAGAAVPAPGRVTLALSGGRFNVEAAQPGEAAGVEATYDRNRHELRETFEPDGQGGWDYRVEFEGKGNRIVRILQGMLGGTKPEVTVRVPVDRPVDLEMQVDNGEARVHLDGMWLREARFDASWAALAVDCSQPLDRPMDALEVGVNMAGVEVEGVGNAGPARFLLEVSQGGAAVDLSGAWTRDAHVGITGSRAGIAVKLPEGVRVEGDGISAAAPADAELPLPTIYIDSNVTDGEVEFVD